MWLGMHTVSSCERCPLFSVLYRKVPLYTTQHNLLCGYTYRYVIVHVRHVCGATHCSYGTITLVSGAFTILNLLSTSMSVILASIIASRIPMQFLGPLPNGMKAPGWMEDFWDLLNLQQRRRRRRVKCVCVFVHT